MKNSDKLFDLYIQAGMLSLTERKWEASTTAIEFLNLYESIAGSSQNPDLIISLCDHGSGCEDEFCEADAFINFSVVMPMKVAKEMVEALENHSFLCQNYLFSRFVSEQNFQARCERYGRSHIEPQLYAGYFFGEIVFGYSNSLAWTKALQAEAKARRQANKEAA